jgi:hypothetical protein
MISLGDGNLAVLELRLDRLAMNFIRIGGGYFDLGEFLRLIQYHVAHIHVMIGITSLAQERLPNFENLIQLEF